MAFGLGELRLSPHAFWAMTPRELEAVIARGTYAAGFNPRSLRALLNAHHDGQEPQGSDHG
jgi:uncharacterized phage protein (TIGR02216 family)